jgi:ATP-dependent DNA ligase
MPVQAADARRDYPTLSGLLSAMPKTFTDTPEPMLARIADRLPIGPAWSYEVKWDGYRCLAMKTGDAVTLRSRNASNLTTTYPGVASAIRTLSAARVIVDDFRFGMRFLATDATYRLRHPGCECTPAT